jgi:ketosteroid isomerase-like protein
LALIGRNHPRFRLDVGDDRLVILIRFGGHARHTGIDVALSPGHILDLRDGKFVRWRVFADHEQAREAAGLPPS